LYGPCLFTQGGPAIVGEMGPCVARTRPIAFRWFERLASVATGGRFHRDTQVEGLHRCAAESANLCTSRAVSCKRSFQVGGLPMRGVRDLLESRTYRRSSKSAVRSATGQRMGNEYTNGREGLWPIPTLCQLGTFGLTFTHGHDCGGSCRCVLTVRPPHTISPLAAGVRGWQVQGTLRVRCAILVVPHRPAPSANPAHYSATALFVRPLRCPARRQFWRLSRR